MMIRRLAVLAASALMLGGGLATVSVADSAHAQKYRAQTYGVVGSNVGDCVQRFQRLSQNLAGRHMISMQPCGRWNGGRLWSGSITVRV